MDDEARSRRRGPAGADPAEPETVQFRAAAASPTPNRRPPPRRVEQSAQKPRRYALRGGQTLLALLSVIVLALTGYGWAFIHDLGGITKFDVLGEGGTNVEPLDGSRDILLVGMDSRTDAQGNPLPDHILNDVLHVGGDGEEDNTDTLILLHIPQDTEEAVAISIPRDSYVKVPGFGKHKVNSAYPRAKNAEKDRLKDEGGHSKREIEQLSSQAGARKLVETIELLTGRTLDNYASINLLGFYQITKAVGGVPVCLKQAVDDRHTDLHLPAGRQTISGKDALGFVRQRHGLPRGDLDRIERQQAFMAGLARKVLSANTLADPAQLSQLIDAIKKSIVLNTDWDLMTFAQRLRGLAGGDIQFYTIPVIRSNLMTPYDGMAVKVDPQRTRQFITGLTSQDEPDKPQGKTSEQQRRNADITVNVRNSTGTPNLAGNVADALAGKGFSKGVVANASPRARTVVRHAPDERAKAQRVASALGGQITIAADANLSPGHLTVLLGSDFDPGAIPTGKNSDSPQQRPPQQSAPEGGAQGSASGGADDTDKPAPPKEPITADEIPCVN